MKFSSIAISPVAIRPWNEIIEEAAVEVFSIMAGAALGKPEFHCDGPSGDLTAMVALAGALRGVLSIRCSHDAAMNIAGEMLDGQQSSPEQLRDAMGEICNVIAGAAKAKVPGLADSCLLSVPTVIAGENYECFAPSDSQHHRVVLTFQGYPLWLTLTTHR